MLVERVAAIEWTYGFGVLQFVIVELPCLFISTRIAHYLKMIGRQSLGSFEGRPQIERVLNDWINQYVSDSEAPTRETLAKRPLRKAQVHVSEIPGEPGWYRYRVNLVRRLKNMGGVCAMSKVHIVVQGECLASIAATEGFADWRTIYNDSANDDFRRLRPNPNQIFPGDQIIIPVAMSASFDVSAWRRHVFRVREAQTLLRLPFEDGGALKYELNVENVKTSGQVDERAASDLVAAPLLGVRFDRRHFDLLVPMRVAVGHLRQLARPAVAVRGEHIHDLVDLFGR